MCLIGFLLPFHNIKCAGGYTFLKSLISFVNFFGAFSCFLVTSPVSKTFAYLGLVLRRITPSESACFQLDFSIIFEKTGFQLEDVNSKWLPICCNSGVPASLSTCALNLIWSQKNFTFI